MIIKESAVFLSIGLPMIIIYVLAIIASVEKNKFYFSLRDACIATISLDLYKIMSLIKIDGNEINSSWVLISMCFGFLALHISIIFFVRKTSHAAINKFGKSKFSLFINVYLGLFCLMTNAVSFGALIEMAGGIN